MGHHQRAPANESGTKQRRDRDIITFLTERESLTRIRDRMRRKTAVPRIAGEERIVAEIFHTILAEAANAAGVSEPRDSDAIADAVGGDVWAHQIDPADDFVPGDYRIPNVGQLAVDDMKVGSANATGIHADANFSVTWKRIVAFAHP